MKIFANDATSKGLISKIYKQLTQVKKQTKKANPIEKGTKDLNIHFSKTQIWPIGT